jgi:pyruvate dehydrogenase E2 component (dihydrolipoamide acetyltransferase)
MATMLSAQRASCFGGAAAPLRAASRSRAPAGARRAVTRSAIKEIFMPALSSTMTEGKIVSWLKSEGDQVTKGDTVVVVESDKADMDVESFFTGWLAVVTVPDGSVAAVGAPIAYIAETKEEIPAAKAKAGGAAPAAAAAPAPAPAPAAPAPAAAAPPPPPAAAGAPPPPPPPPPAAAAPAAAPARTDGKVFVSPYARKLAKELKVDIDTVRGSGLAGRVTAADVEAAAGRKPAPAAAAAAPAAPKPAVGGAAPPAAPAKAAAAPAKAAAAPVPAGGRTEPLPGMQVAVAKNMLVSLSVRAAPQPCALSVPRKPPSATTSTPRPPGRHPRSQYALHGRPAVPAAAMRPPLDAARAAPRQPLTPCRVASLTRSASLLALQRRCRCRASRCRSRRTRWTRCTHRSSPRVSP